MNIGVIGDLHLKENLGYADYVSGRRLEEKKEILDFIVNSFKDCDSVVFLGDQLDARNNPSSVVREFTEFIERFNDKVVYIIAGNHEIKGDCTTAIDYLAEIKKDNWHIINKQEVRTINGLTFCPYFLKGALDVNSDQEASEAIMAKIEKESGKILFVHHAISDSSVNSGMTVNVFPEPILDRARLLKKFDLVVGGHIHKPENKGDKVVVAGSVFNNEVGETQKYIYKIVEDPHLQVKTLKLPGRPIYKVENPTPTMLLEYEQNSIVKAIVTDKNISVDDLKSALERFDASMLLEQYKDERKKVHFDNGSIDLSIESLLQIYSKDKNIDYTKLKAGFDLIK